MNRIKYSLLSLLIGIALLAGLAKAQDTKENTIETLSVVQQGGVVNVKIGFKQPLQAVPPNFSIANPARIVLDFSNMQNGLGKNNQSYNEGDLKSINIIQATERTRLVLNLNRAMGLESRLEENNLILALSPSAKEMEYTAKVEHFSQASPYTIENGIRDIVFRRGADGEAKILVDLSSPSAGIDIRQVGRNLVVDFLNVKVPVALRKKQDVTDFATPVTSFNTAQMGDNSRMTISPNPNMLWEHNAYQTDNQFVIEVKRIIEDPNKLVQGTRGGYQGEKLSLNFQNVEVRRLLQVIGEFTGLNIVVSDSVGGSITLILRDVPWDQALDIILQQKGLDMRKNGNVILIAPREEIATKEKLEFESKQQISDLEPLRTESFQMNYINGEDLKKLLVDPKQTILSKRGSALLDNRSNMLFVQDTPSRLDDVRALIAKVDKPARQVMIEARIVEAGDSFSKNLGIRLATGTPKLTKNADGSTTVETTFDPKLGPIHSQGLLPWGSGYGGLNLPATPRSGTAATYSLSLFNSSFTRFISAEISALEADGRGKIISSPRVMTANQVEALIEQGVEIPYQQATSSGATSVSFRKANLSLKVKPHITPDGKISMMLDVNKDTPNTTISTGSGIAIDTKHVKTEVLVDNGGTVVIGGIYTQETRNNTERVPFFGDLPYIGWLFKRREWIDNKTELLIFITPRILTEGMALR